jgi:hypothetical protein
MMEVLAYEVNRVGDASAGGFCALAGSHYGELLPAGTRVYSDRLLRGYVESADGTNWEWSGVSEPIEFPALTENGTMGGDGFAASATRELASSYQAYNAFRKDGSGSWWEANEAQNTLYFYSPIPMAVRSLTPQNPPGSTGTILDYEVIASNTFGEWTTIASGTNTALSSGQLWDSIAIDPVNYGPWNYIGLRSLSGVGGYTGISELNITATRDYLVPPVASEIPDSTQSGYYMLRVMMGKKWAHYEGNFYPANAAPAGAYPLDDGQYQTIASAIAEGYEFGWDDDQRPYLLIPFVQPVLSADGTKGGDKFACYSSGVYNSNYAYYAFDSNTTNYWSSLGTGTSNWLGWYNPDPLTIFNVDFRQSTGTSVASGLKILSSYDGNAWNNEAQITDAVAGWNSILVSSQTRAMYWRIINTGSSSARMCIYEIKITGNTKFYPA